MNPQQQAHRMQQQADHVVEKIMEKCGGDTWCQYLVDKRQFEEYPAMTLLVARVIRAALGFFIVVCVVALVVSYFFEGKITTLEEIDQQEFMQAPNLAVCPQPWGTKFQGEGMFVHGATMIQVPSAPNYQPKELQFNRTDCSFLSDRMGTCQCFDFTHVFLHPHGERGDLQFFDYIRLEFDAKSDPKQTSQYAFGFYPPNMRPPQQWSYAELGSVSEGDIRYEEVAHGKTEFTEGTTEPRFGFSSRGFAPNPGGRTVLVFGYNKFLAFITSSFTERFSIFAIMTVLITFCAAINNFGLFDIFFPEKVSEEDPTQLEPNMCCVMVFGSCCTLCTPKAEQEAALAKKLASSTSPSPVTSQLASPEPPKKKSPEDKV
jgi:hypothetical protein